LKLNFFGCSGEKERKRRKRKREGSPSLLIKQLAYWKEGRKEGRNKKRMITQKIEY